MAVALTVYGCALQRVWMSLPSRFGQLLHLVAGTSLMWRSNRVYYPDAPCPSPFPFPFHSNPGEFPSWSTPSWWMPDHGLRMPEWTEGILPTGCRRPLPEEVRCSLEAWLLGEALL